MNIFAKLQSYFTAAGPFEPMAQFRYFMYINNKPLFVSTSRTLRYNKKYVEFEVCQYSTPDSYQFMINVISHKIKKINGILQINMLGVCGDTIEEVTLINARIKDFYINEKLTVNGVPPIRLKLKFDTKVTVIN